MEQRLDTTYLRPGLVERSVAIGICAAGLGIGILLAAWGISFLWHTTPPETTVRIANPELRVTQDSPLKVTQDKPFVVAETTPVNAAKAPGSVAKVPDAPANDTNTNTASGAVIRREVTVFWYVTHGLGTVVTGWNYKDGSGGIPINQFCYYTVANPDHVSTKVDIATDRVALPMDAELVPDLEAALTKCQWAQD